MSREVEDPDQYCPDCGGETEHAPYCPMPAKLKEGK